MWCHLRQVVQTPLWHCQQHPVSAFCHQSYRQPTWLSELDSISGPALKSLGVLVVPVMQMGTFAPLPRKEKINTICQQQMVNFQMFLIVDKRSYLVHEGTDIKELEGQISLCRHATYWQGEFITTQIQVVQNKFPSHLCQCCYPLNLEEEKEHWYVSV